MKRILAGSAAALFLALIRRRTGRSDRVRERVACGSRGGVRHSRQCPGDSAGRDIPGAVGSSSFDSRGNPATDYNLLNFLLTGGAFNIVEHTAGALLNTTNNHLYEFLGQVTVTNGQNFNVLHDDGLTLIIGGLTVIDVPGPTRRLRRTRYTRARPVRSISSWSTASAVVRQQLLSLICPLLPRFPSLARCCYSPLA